MPNIEQQYARIVYELVAGFQENYASEHPDWIDQYGSMALRLPILVHNAGLVQALAYVEDRGKDSHKELLNHLAEVLGYANRSELLAESRIVDFKSYQYLTRKTNIALSWFKRFAHSVLGVEEGAE